MTCLERRVLVDRLHRLAQRCGEAKIRVEHYDRGATVYPPKDNDRCLSELWDIVSEAATELERSVVPQASAPPGRGGAR